MANYIFQALKLPFIALVLACGFVLLTGSFIEYSLIEKLLVGAGIFSILLTVKNHFSQTTLLLSAREHLDGISEFEKDVTKRLDEVSLKVDDTEALTSLSQRFDVLEQRFNSSSRARAKNPTTNIPEVNENISQAALLLDPKIVPISRAAASQKESKISSDLSKHLDEGKLQMFLQPVLTLPERVVTHYEAFARLVLDEKNIINCSEFLVEAERSGAIVEIDKQMLIRIIHLLRDLKGGNSEIDPEIFWNVSYKTLADEKSFKEITEILKANTRLCRQILLEISQTNYLSLEPQQLENLSLLKNLGLNISIDQCDNADLLEPFIQSNDFSFIKIPITALIGYEDEGHEPAGLQISRQTRKNGPRLIATHVEEEYQVMELIDQNILMGQGHLFSEPRPVKNRKNNPIADTDSLAST